MNNASTKSVLWVNLERFGAKLTVATNPTLGRNFLKFTIVDRELFTKTCGLADVDIYEVMRDANFAYAASEARSKSDRVYDQVIAEGGNDSASKLSASEAQSQLYFYCPSIQLKKELIQQFVPAVADADFRQMSIAEIKHFDHEYLSDDQVKSLIGQHQVFDGAEPSVYYTIPRDREVIAATEKSVVTLNELLAFRDFPPQHVAKRSVLTPELADIVSFNSVRAVERVMVGQTLGLDGLPLKAPRPSAAVIAYASYDEAVAANGGDVESVERVQFPYGLPIAFDLPRRRILLLKDARYIEVPNTLYLPQKDVAARNVQAHWKFIDALDKMFSEFQSANSSGVLDQGRWDDPEVFGGASTSLKAIFDRMQVAANAVGEKSFFSQSEAHSYSGLRAEAFESRYSQAFMSFLEAFEKRLYPEMLEKESAQIATQALQKSARRSAATRAVVAPAQPIEGRREDAGEKIGGARKDYARAYLTAREIQSLNAREMIDVVTKDNVWPPLDFVAMREAGVTPAVAHAVRELRNKLPVNPLRGGRNDRMYLLQQRGLKEPSQKMAEDFVNSVAFVRDALSSVKSKEEFLAAVYFIRQQNNLEITTDDGHYGRVTGMMWDARSSFCDGAGFKFCRNTLPSITVKQDGSLHSHQLTRLMATADAITDGKWDSLIKEKGASGRLVKQKVERPEPEMPHLDAVDRSGPDHRGDRNVDEHMLMAKFSFRAVEYGEWLAQRERQVVLNHAYDAFMDLAEVLRLPPAAMGLGGKLAVAFGSRGRGGKGAGVAHYESSSNVINMTRLKGAGKLAHEWGHAFDYAIATMYGVSRIDAVSESFSVINKNQSPVVNAITTIINAGSERYLTKEETAYQRGAVSGKKAEKPQSLNDHFIKRMTAWIARLDSQLPAESRNGQFKDFALSQLHEHFVQSDDDEIYMCGGKFHDVDGYVRDLTQAIDLQIGNSWQTASYTNMDYCQSLVNWYDICVSDMRKHVAKWTPTSNTGPTRFLEDAQYYDSFRSKPYWSTRVELFARSFEGWVQDQIESNPERKSQYLVHGCRNNEERDYSGYPRGDDRVKVASAFESLFYGLNAELIQVLSCDPASRYLVRNVK